ncbi:MAG: gamma-glutamyltransferase [Armatimonadetes bacterium]|nr:gamma-glutamyltransferase [Armatimonadota bacterium]
MHAGADRPTITAPRGVVASGHWLASAAGLRILHAGGNAIDAGVAAGLVLNVVHNEMCSVGGVAPIIVYHAKRRRVETISGLGRWPRAASIEYFQTHHGGTLPGGMLRCVHPAAADAWFTALERYGTMSFGQVAQDAAALAEGGFPVHELISWRVSRHLDEYKQYPLNRRWFVPDGEQAIQPGRRLRMPDLAVGLRRLAAEEARHRRKGRAAALRAARDLIYKGEIAREMVVYGKKYGGLFTLDDMADFFVQVEPPIRTTYRNYEIYGCGPWCQGPVFLMALNILEHFDLKALGLGTPAYYHVITEALKLAFSDREKFVGDPEFVDVPIGGMLSKEYAKARAAQIRMDRAYPGMPRHGDPQAYGAEIYGGGRRRTGEVAARAAAAVAAPSDAAGHVARDGEVGRRGAREGGDGRSRSGARDGGAGGARARGGGRVPGRGSTARGGPHRALDPDLEDTTYVAAMDDEGNIFSCTPSDGYPGVPIVPRVGFSFSKRGSQSWLEPDHASSLAPWKRPRLTPNPALVFKDGRPWMALGTPGLDMQPQAMLQAFIAHVEFGLPLQAAIEVPRVGTYCFPSTAYPHEMEGVLRVEGRVPEETYRALADLGHRVERWPDRTHSAGAVCMIARDFDTGFLHGGADPRRMNYAVGY